MAIGTPGNIGSVSGKLGGNEVQLRKDGFVMKRCKDGVKSLTPAQIQAQNMMGAIRARWAALSNSERATWQAYGIANPVRDRFGRLRALNGFQAFASMPSDFRYADSPYYMTTAPVLRFPNQWTRTGALTAPYDLEITNAGNAFYAALYCGVRIARWCPNTTRAPKTWKSLGMKEIVSYTTMYFDDAMEGEKQLTIAGEIIAVNVYLYHPAYKPLDYGYFFVTAG